MKVYIGPYTTWWGPYQIAELLKYVGVSEDRHHEIGRWLADTWVNTVCEWIESKKHRKIKVRIDKYDTWSMDNTLAHIVLPMLKQLKDAKHGSPMTDDEDAPEHLRSTAAPPKETEYDADGNIHLRWTWIMEQMIWSFEQLVSDDEPRFFEKGKFDKDGFEAYHARVNNGLRLFGKYYRGLWD